MTQTIHSSKAPSSFPTRVGQLPTRFVYSGVLFEWIGANGAISIPPESIFQRFLAPPFAGPILARVSCVVEPVRTRVLTSAPVGAAADIVASPGTVAKASSGPDGQPGSSQHRDESCPELRTELHGGFEGDTAHIRSRAAECLVRRISPANYIALGQPLGDARDASPVLASVAAAVLHAEGAMFLHAAAAEFEGRAILFVGPSGEGKSTAVQGLVASDSFAVDRVCVFRTQKGWHAWSQPGGTVGQLASRPSKSLVLPLGGILRVRKADHLVIQACTQVDALFVLRESLQMVSLDAGSANQEQQALAALSQLAAEVRVGELHFEKHTDLTAAVAQWTRAEPEATVQACS